jgi:hypothetical protein
MAWCTSVRSRSCSGSIVVIQHAAQPLTSHAAAAHGCIAVARLHVFVAARLMSRSVATSGRSPLARVHPCRRCRPESRARRPREPTRRLRRLRTRGTQKYTASSSGSTAPPISTHATAQPRRTRRAPADQAAKKRVSRWNGVRMICSPTSTLWRAGSPHPNTKCTPTSRAVMMFTVRDAILARLALTAAQTPRPRSPAEAARIADSQPASVTSSKRARCACQVSLLSFFFNLGNSRPCGAAY